MKQAIPNIAELGGDPKQWSKFDGWSPSYLNVSSWKADNAISDVFQVRLCAKHPTTTSRDLKES